MKVLNLGCAQAHVFEGWFGSEAEFQDQLAHGLIDCPFCGDKAVHKLPSAPRLNLGSGRDGKDEGGVVAQADVARPTPAAAVPGELQAAFMRELREVVAKAEDVGEQFASEARRIHHGETPQRHIRGQATVAETVELLEEGIAVLPLPELPGLKGPLH